MMRLNETLSEGGSDLITNHILFRYCLVRKVGQPNFNLHAHFLGGEK